MIGVAVGCTAALIAVGAGLWGILDARPLPGSPDGQTDGDAGIPLTIAIAAGAVAIAAFLKVWLG